MDTNPTEEATPLGVAPADRIARDLATPHACGEAPSLPEPYEKYICVQDHGTCKGGDMVEAFEVESIRADESGTVVVPMGVSHDGVRLGHTTLNMNAHRLPVQVSNVHPGDWVGRVPGQGWTVLWDSNAFPEYLRPLQTSAVEKPDEPYEVRCYVPFHDETMRSFPTMLEALKDARILQITPLATGMYRIQLEGDDSQNGYIHITPLQLIALGEELIALGKKHTFKCQHPGHIDGTSCQDGKVVGCHPDCECCMGVLKPAQAIVDLYHDLLVEDICRRADGREDEPASSAKVANNTLREGEFVDLKFEGRPGTPHTTRVVRPPEGVSDAAPLILCGFPHPVEPPTLPNCRRIYPAYVCTEAIQLGGEIVEQGDQVRAVQIGSFSFDPHAEEGSTLLVPVAPEVDPFSVQTGWVLRNNLKPGDWYVLPEVRRSDHDDVLAIPRELFGRRFDHLPLTFGDNTHRFNTTGLLLDRLQILIRNENRHHSLPHIIQEIRDVIKTGSIVTERGRWDRWVVVGHQGLNLRCHDPQGRERGFRDIPAYDVEYLGIAVPGSEATADFMDTLAAGIAYAAAAREKNST